jgi:hypothetical protein
LLWACGEAACLAGSDTAGCSLHGWVYKREEEAGPRCLNPLQSHALMTQLSSKRSHLLKVLPPPSRTELGTEPLTHGILGNTYPNHSISPFDG